MDDQTNASTMGSTEWILLVILSVLWGGSFFFYKVLVSQLPPFTVVLGRVGLAAIVLNLLLVVRRDPMPRDPKLWMAFVILGLLNNVVPFTLFALLRAHEPAGLVSTDRDERDVGRAEVLAQHALRWPRHRSGPQRHRKRPV